ncbi:MAG: ABC transporter substrate-binding protein [Patescibacteria group bacterium]
MNKKIIITLILAVCLLGVGWSAGRHNSSPANGPTIGAIIPLTGPLASFGEKLRNGLLLYGEEHPDVNIVFEDDAGESKRAISAFIKLSTVDKANLIVGPFGPVSSAALYASLNEEHLQDTIFLAVSMCADEFKAYVNMLCTYPSPLYQINKSFQFLSREGKKSITPIVTNDAFGQTIAGAFDQGAQNNQLANDGAVLVDGASQQFYTEAAKAIAQKSDVIVVSAASPDVVVKVVKALKERGYRGMIMVATDLDAGVAERFSSILEGVYSMGLPKLEFKGSFFANYKSNYDGQEPDLYATYGYLLPQILDGAQDSTRGNQLTTSDVIKYAKDHSLEFPVDGINFNNQKQIELPMLIYQIQGGKLAEVFVAR